MVTIELIINLATYEQNTKMELHSLDSQQNIKMDGMNSINGVTVFRKLMKLMVVSMCTLSSSANEQDRQSDDYSELGNTSRVLDSSEITCVSVTSQIIPKRNRKRKCHKSCMKRGNCIGYHFNRNEKTCSVYFSASQGSSRKYCAKTSAILETATKSSCAVVDTWLFPSVPNWNKCRRRCTGDRCYGFEYNDIDKNCTLYMVGDEEPASDGVRCDKKSSMVEFLKCPCFNDKDVDSTIDDIIKGTESTSLQKKSCLISSEGSYGIYHQYNSLSSSSFSVSGMNSYNSGTCMSTGTVKQIGTEEADACFSILEDACETLDATMVNAGPAPDAICPCYNEDDLSTAIHSIKSGSKEVIDGSCDSGSSTSISLFYRDPSYPIYIEGYNVRDSELSRRCRFGGDIVIGDISTESASHCSILLHNACNQLETHLDQ